MAKYTATQTKGTYESFEEAVAGLETLIEAADTGKKWIRYNIEKLDGGRWGAWLVYTAED
jgi:hypothetical protein